jgi:hypothetical protein
MLPLPELRALPGLVLHLPLRIRWVRRGLRFSVDVVTTSRIMSGVWSRVFHLLKQVGDLSRTPQRSDYRPPGCLSAISRKEEPHASRRCDEPPVAVLP